MTAPRFSMLLMTLFAGVALVLAALGVYGVTAYAVALRTREIGIRMALGALPGDMLRLIAGRGMALAVLGIVAGSFGAFVLSGFLESLLFQTRPANAGSHVLVASVLLVVALVAILIPARRASRIDPRQALTSE
jgi:putative ABC transport system permease protein